MIGRDEVLYRDDLAKVSRLWLTNESTSYAIRTLIRVSFVERKSPPVTTLLLFFVALALLFFSCLHLWYDRIPDSYAWILIGLSVLLLLGAVWYAFIKQPVYLIKAAFLDGTVVKIMRRKPEQGHGLHKAINKAMSLHRYYVSPYDEHVIDALTDEPPDNAIGEAARAVRKRRRLRSVLALLSSNRK